MKITVIDNDDDFVPFEIEGKTEVEIERKLIDWYLECGSFEETIKMIELTKQVKIKIIDNMVVEE